MIKEFNKIWEKIEEYKTIVISGHVHPDGDAYGSMFGLKAALKYLYPDKDIQVISDDINENFSFLGTPLCSESLLQSQIDFTSSLLIVVDTSDIERIANSKFNNFSYKIKLDHHPTNILEDRKYFDISIVDIKSAATCELLTKFLKTKKCLSVCNEALYTGIMTDTGFFHYNVKPSTFKAAAELLKSGVDLMTLLPKLSLEDINVLKFKGLVLSNIAQTKNKATYMFIPYSLWHDEFKVDESKAGSIVNELSAIKDSYIWLALIEYPDHIRVRIRSRLIECRSIAVKFNGGGHPFASGFSIPNNVVALAQVLDAVDMHLEKFKNKIIF